MHRFGLSKSKIAMFEQCSKRLWLSVYRPELAEHRDDVQIRFATGHEVGAIACALLPNGVMVEAVPDLAAALSITKALLNGSDPRPIFEATLEHDGVLVRIDVLEPDGLGGWHMAEVKSSTRAKDHHLTDLATQLWVARKAGLSISSAVIRHINNDFILERHGKFNGLFADTHLMAEADTLAETRADVVAAARKTLGGLEPAILPGGHCSTPFPCEFVSNCQAALPTGPEWPITVLPYGGGRRWIELGVEDLKAVDPAALSNETHRRVYQATVSGEPYHSPETACAAITDWAFPRTWLDFETIAFAVPRWLGTRPYQQVPFQFSAHVENELGEICHHEFLDLDGTDPRRPCAESLAALLPKTGAVIGYNASFERTRIIELANIYPDLADRLQDIATRIVDLLPVTRASWYHRDQRGSWSLKAVLPTIAAELDYRSLEVSDGTSAQNAYLEAIAPEVTRVRKEAIDRALRAYCARDTEAMMVMARHLCASSCLLKETAFVTAIA